jgi:hypothetical protein
VDIDQEAFAESADIYYGDALRQIGFGDGFTTFLMETAQSFRELEAAPPEYIAYAEALTDLHRLTEEIRFEGALAVLLLVDYRVKRDSGEAPPIEDSTFPIPVEAGALLRGYFRDPPSPGEFFREPHVKISGGRILSRWLAAQLLDSALFRAVAATDRLAVLLHACAGLEFPRRKAGEPRYPTFTADDLRKLNAYYETEPEWRELREIAVNPLLTFVRSARNQFTHARRLPTELHGDRFITYISDSPDVAGIDVADHVGLVLAMFDAILRPAVQATGKILASRARGTTQ